MLCGLGFGRIGRQEAEEMHRLGHREAQAGMPARLIQDEHALLLRSSPDRAREGGQLGREEREVDRARWPGERPCARWPGARSRRRSARCAKPTTERQAQRCRTKARGRWPIGAQTRRSSGFKPACPMRCSSTNRPERDTGLRERRGYLPQQRPEGFLQISCCSASASACRGRGTCGLCLRRTR
jgi:hypothetical protein